MIAKVQLLAALFGSASAASSGKPHLIFMLAESVAIPRPPEPASCTRLGPPAARGAASTTIVLTDSLVAAAQTATTGSRTWRTTPKCMAILPT